jgi:hypothetical protein
MQYDSYEGWVDSKYQSNFRSNYDLLSDDSIVLNANLIEYITGPNNLLM